MRGRALVAGVLLVAAVVALVVAFASGDSGSSSGAAEQTTNAAVATPLWSVRRVPEPVVDAVGAQHLQGALDAAAPGDGTCFVVSAGNHTLATHGADTPLIGASTQKLLVAAAALSVIGPDATFQTRAVASALPADGTVDQLWLVGGGDPVLATGNYVSFLQSQPKSKGDVTTSLEALADAIVAKGVHSIPGGIVGDDSRYDKQRYLPTWKDTYRTDGEIGPISALTVNDGFSTWSPARKTPVDDPTRNAAAQLTDLLEARGVRVGAPSTGAAPGNATDIATATSPPLRDIVHSMLSSSDNLTAEMLTKELGVQASKQGTTGAGVAAITAKLKELGVPLADGALKDGSGLDRGNRVTCGTLVAALTLAQRPEFATLYDGLPVAGRNGTLVGDFIGTPLEGNFRGKTGSLDGVTGLTGVFDLGRRIQFAFLDNGAFSETQGAVIREGIGDIIGRYPDSPPVDALVPAPQ
ncbi:MAG TPA: D-alanyl-D-alanine carboxypeptidase/D-alanyl-D-alanine-endopeptidase [Acidimicrobiia bacterium]|jgi:D-alanyl-D-alanine carboxypeptidase/D-alanyl-D-alanine-endopeptidase (penicillin-binding protein 4)